MSKTICLDISVLNDKDKTGVGVYTYELVKSLLKFDKEDNFISKGEKFHFILFGFATLKTYEYLKNIEFKNYPNVELKIYKMPARAFRRAFLLWQKINWPKIESFVGPVDIFHSFNWNLPPVKNTKLVATIFDMTPFLFPDFHQPKTIQLDKVRLNRIKQNADLVLTISENSKNDFLKFAPEKKVEVIYPGVRLDFRAKIKNEEVKKVLDKYGLKKGYILSVGTLEPRKNIRNLIKAYLLTGVKEKLILVGNWGWEKSDLKQLIEKNKDKIITTGFLEDQDLIYLYLGAICLIYPSLYEGFGIPVLEAMSLGIPVITSGNSSLTEVGGSAVLYIDPQDSNSIKKALIEIVNKKKLRDDLIKKGLKQANKFSWETSAKKLISLYQQL